MKESKMDIHNAAQIAFVAGAALAAAAPVFGLAYSIRKSSQAFKDAPGALDRVDYLLTLEEACGEEQEFPNFILSGIEIAVLGGVSAEEESNVTVAEIADKLGVTLAKVRNTLRHLKGEGLVQLVAMFDDDGFIRGRGYVTTAKGARAARDFNAKRAYGLADV